MEELTIREMAELLGVTYLWCLKLCKEGKVKARKTQTKLSRGEMWLIEADSVKKYRDRKAKNNDDKLP